MLEYMHTVAVAETMEQVTIDEKVLVKMWYWGWNTHRIDKCEWKEKYQMVCHLF